MAKKLQRKIPVPKAAAAVPTVAGAAPKGGGLSLNFRRGRVAPRVLAEFTSQLATLLNAGIPITRSLRVLEGQMPNGEMKRICGALIGDVEGGTPLSEAMTKHELTFDDLYTNMVRAGEAGGVQEAILQRLADFLEKSEGIKAKVKGALAYPVVIMVIAIIVLVLVFIFVIPQFEQIFASFPGGTNAMHWTTRAVIGLGHHLERWWWSYVLGVLVIFAVHRVLVARVAGYRSFVDRRKLDFPLFGVLARKNQVARFARTFGTLIQSGVPHLSALEILGDAATNVHMERAVHGVHASIREGAGIAVPMGESGMFDDLVVNMVDVGEQTGELDRMLAKVADRYETEVDRTVDTTFRMIEPIMLAVMGVVVGFIVYALFMPLLSMMRSLKQ